MNGLKKRNDFLKELTVEAGNLAQVYFSKSEELNVEYKGLQDAVSEADRSVERFIRKKVAENFPDDFCFGEEYGADDIEEGKKLCWVIDPIDGTSCFLSGLKSWCVSIALSDGREIFSGAVFCPGTDEFFSASKNGGAFLNGKKINCDKELSFDQAKFGLGFKHSLDYAAYLKVVSNVIEAKGVFYCNGSGALMCAYAACSKIGTFYEMHINAYDCLAGILIAKEAGCRVNDFLAGNGFFAGNELLICAPQLWELNRRITGLEK